MPAQLTLTAQTPPALPPPADAIIQGTFVFRTEEVVIPQDGLKVDPGAAIYSKTPRAGGRSQVKRIGREPAVVSINAYCYIPNWFRRTTAAARARSSDPLYPLNLWFVNGNRVLFLPKGYTQIPGGSYEITKLETQMVRMVEGAPVEVEYQMEFVGGR